MDFARLMAPCTVEAFFSSHYEKAFSFNQRGEPGYYNEVLSDHSKLINKVETKTI